MQWEMQAELSRKAFLYLENCARIDEQLKLAKTPAQTKALENIAMKILSEVSAVAPLSRADPNYKAYKKISPDLRTLTLDENNGPASVRLKLRKAKAMRDEYVAALGYVSCPVCNGSGNFDGFDCPVCGGDQKIDEKIASEIDLGQYEFVDCPLCHGTGRFRGDNCPGCGGNGQLTRGQAEDLDVDQYDLVDCPVCRGKGTLRGDNCPGCGGNGQLTRGQAEDVDLFN